MPAPQLSMRVGHSDDAGRRRGPARHRPVTPRGPIGNEPFDVAQHDVATLLWQARCDTSGATMAETTAGRLAHNLVERQETINRELARNGVRFGIYRDGTYHDRLFPYDPVPRLIPSDEFDRLGAGLKQRVSALNAFLRDVYSDKRIVRDGVVPEEFVYTSKGYLPQVNGMTPPAGIYAHVAGEDLVQGEDGSWWVLEDNLRIPSGASYPPSSCATSSAT